MQRSSKSRRPYTTDFFKLVGDEQFYQNWRAIKKTYNAITGEKEPEIVNIEELIGEEENVLAVVRGE